MSLPAADHHAFDTFSLRQALGTFATGVTVATCCGADGSAIGLTVNSFSALSLEPPLVLWSLRLSSPSLAEFDEGQWHEGLRRLPVLAGSAAVIECERVSMQAAGDHRLYIGRVLKLQSQPVPPLVYHSGRYHLLGEVL